MSAVASATYLGLVDDALRTMSAAERRDYFRRRVWERHGGICGFCGDLIRFDDMDLDHIQRSRDGGVYEWDNLRPTHRRCNRSDGGTYAGNLRRGSGRTESEAYQTLRLPLLLRDCIKRLAERERRSVNGQIVAMLEEAADSCARD